MRFFSPLFGSKHQKVVLFGSMMMLVYVADGLMAFLAPILIERRVQNTQIMGIILSSSSFFGLLADQFIASRFASRQYQFFSRWLLSLAFFFPMVFLFLPQRPLTFLLAMAVWGIYYEFITFTNYNFVHSTVRMSEHSFVWSIIEAIKSTALIIAPILATYLLSQGNEQPILFTVIGLLGGAFLVYVILHKRTVKQDSVVAFEVVPKKRSFIHEIQLWRILIRKIWPVYTFFFTFILVETCFWTIGPLLTEEIMKQSSFGALLIPAYIAPSFFAPFLVKRLGDRFGKKRIAFGSATVGASVLGIGSFVVGTSILLPCIVFISALFLSLDYPEIEAVFADYMSRIDGYGNDLIGLQATAFSLAWIIGPATAGSLSVVLGNGKTIGVFGLLLAIVSLLLLFVTKRKITMPQKELEQIQPV